MRTSEAGLDLIKEFEGRRLKAYKCPAGVWTIGYGDTKNVKPGMVITPAEADARLKDRLVEFETGVWYALSSTRRARMRQNQFDALVSLAYNIGIRVLQESTVLYRINGGWTEELVREAWMSWVRGGGKVLPGLVRRREAELKLYFGEEK